MHFASCVVPTGTNGAVKAYNVCVYDSIGPASVYRGRSADRLGLRRRAVGGALWSCSELSVDPEKAPSIQQSITDID
jgi:hypothetical protein